MTAPRMLAALVFALFLARPALADDTRPGSNFSFYFAPAPLHAEIVFARLALSEIATTARQGDRRNIADARAALAPDTAEIEEALQAVLILERVQDTRAVVVSSRLLASSFHSVQEIVRTVAGFTYSQNPLLIRSEDFLARAQTDDTAGRRNASVQQLRQVVRSLHDVFESDNRFTRSATEDQREIQDAWNLYREGLIRRDLGMALTAVTPEFNPRFENIFQALGADTSARLTREMHPIVPVEMLGGGIYWYSISKNGVNYFIYFQRALGLWKVALL